MITQNELNEMQARADVPRLIEEVRRLQNELSEVRRNADFLSNISNYEVKYLAKLREETNRILEEAATHKLDFDRDPINWGDLSCVAVESILDDERHSCRIIRIEEASPQSPKLCSYIKDELEKRGYKGLTVKTEW